MLSRSLTTLPLWTTVFLGLVGASPASHVERDSKNDCYYMPGDREYPGAKEWNKLNETVGGRLLATIPPGSVCFKGPRFNSAKCSAFKARYDYPEPHWQDPFDVMMPLWLNNSCNPFLTEAGCETGNLASYTIDTRSRKDITAGTEFAKKHNIRLNVRNTGHDYLGRSANQGGLSLWTNNLKDITFINNYRSSTYEGGAVRLGAGVQGFEVNKAASAKGLRVITGYCPTVGVVGGYTPGGGFSPISSAHGLAADNVLEWEVVTTTGKYLTATREQNSDLFWALSGGGGGTYAIVLSLTTKTFKESQVGGAILTMNNTHDTKFWNMVTEWQKILLDLNNLEGFQSNFIINDSSFLLRYVLWVGHTGEELANALKPFTDYLKMNQFKFNYSTSTDSSYYNYYTRYTDNLPYGMFNINEVLGGRLIPRSTIENRKEDMVATIRNITADGRITFTGISMNVSHVRAGNKPGDNAVNPAFRDTIYTSYTQGWWDAANEPISKVVQLQKDTNEIWVPQLEKLSPGGGTYLNEGTYDLDTWKHDYFGSNYGRLLKIKNKYDPDSQLYARPNVGHDVYTVASDGRLCKKR